MHQELLSRDGVPTAQEVAQLVDLSPEGQALLRPEANADEFLALLRETGLHADALRFLAQALPKRHAVWWSCLAIRQVLGNAFLEEGPEALCLAEMWVVQPTEENRRAAMASAERGEFQDAGCWAAVAAFWSDGSMAPPEAPEVPPGPELTGKGVSGALMLAAATDPAQMEARQIAFLDEGLEVARGTRPWPEAAF